MAKYRLIWTSRFTKKARRWLRIHPNLRQVFEQTLIALNEDPFAPSLRLHALSGRLSDCYAISVTYSDRIILTLEISDKEITLLDIGSHDEVYR